MNNAKQSTIRKRISKDILRRILLRILLVFFLYMALGGAVAFFMAIYYKQNIWYGSENFYKVTQYVKQNLTVCISIYIIAGFILICTFYLLKLLSYLEKIIDVTEELFFKDEAIISLPNDLSEVEIRLNEIKRKVLNSHRTAREAEQRKNDLVVYLAHDLKTPLTSVIGYLTLLHDERQISSKLQEKYLAIALNKAERLEDLINEFFEITRFNLTHLTLETSRINLTRMLEQTVYEFQPMFAERDLKCRLLIEPNLMLLCDPEKLQRVFDNLLRNAVNYSFEHSVISVNVSHSDTRLVLLVKNYGHKIPPEKLEHIFEQFFRLDAARTSRSGGSGLGLAVAREIVELHHGSITAESSDEIVRFRVELPYSS